MSCSEGPSMLATSNYKPNYNYHANNTQNRVVNFPHTEPAPKRTSGAEMSQRREIPAPKRPAPRRGAEMFCSERHLANRNMLCIRACDSRLRCVSVDRGGTTLFVTLDTARYTAYKLAAAEVVNRVGNVSDVSADVELIVTML